MEIFTTWRCRRSGRMAAHIQTQQSRLGVRAGSSIAVNDQRLAGVLLFTLAAQFMTVIMLAASIAPDYDFSGAAISDLGVIRETALLFNVSLVVVGLLNISGGYLLWRTHRRPWLLTFYALAGLGAIGAGVVSLNSSDLHSIFALVAFLFFNLEAIATAPMLR